MVISMTVFSPEYLLLSMTNFDPILIQLYVFRKRLFCEPGAIFPDC